MAQQPDARLVRKLEGHTMLQSALHKFDSSGPPIPEVPVPPTPSMPPIESVRVGACGGRRRVDPNSLPFSVGIDLSIQNLQW